jgi:opacity protein-like surface antigen
MKRFLAAAVAAAALAAAAPASAHPPRYDGRAYHDQRAPDRTDSRYDQRYDQRGDFRGGPHNYERRFSRDDLERLQWRIDRAYRSGALNRYEARRLNWQLSELRDRSRYYWRTDGISWRERQDLEARFDRLRFDIQRQIRDDDYRGEWRR